MIKRPNYLLSDDTYRNSHRLMSVSLLQMAAAGKQNSPLSLNPPTVLQLSKHFMRIAELCNAIATVS